MGESNAQRPLRVRAEKLAMHLHAAGFVSAARGLPQFVDHYGIPLVVADASVEILERNGALVAVAAGHVVATEHGVPRRTNQAGLSEDSMPVRQFRCDHELFHRLEQLAEKRTKGNTSRMIRELIAAAVAADGGSDAAR